MPQQSKLFNDKVLLRTLPGLGVDQAAVTLDFLVNKRNNMAITKDNRSKADSSISRQFFKLAFLSQKAIDYTGSEYIMHADKQLIKQYMHDNFLNNNTKLKIVTSHFRRIDYDYIFDDFYKVDIAVNKDYLIKTYLIYFYKYALHIQDDYIIHSGGETIPFYNPLLPSRNPLQAKLKEIFFKMANGDTTTRIPMYLFTLAEDNKAQDDFDFFFKDTLDRMIRYVNIPYKSNLQIDSENYLFDESLKSVDLLIERYDNQFSNNEYKQIRNYMTKKVIGNHEIIEKFNYNPSLEILSYDNKLEWLKKNCIPHIEQINKQCNFN